MKYDHFAADMLFIDGPVAVYLNRAPTREILEAFWRLSNNVRLAAEQLGAEPPAAEGEGNAPPTPTETP